MAIDHTALMRIRSLELRARGIVEGLWRGLHRSPFHGFSVEFSEYRAYAKGDDPRFIDWKVAARTDRHYVKKFEDETNLRCQLLVDQSRSMAYGSAAFTKHDYAATLAATLAMFLSQQGDAIGLTTFGERIGEHMPARNRPGHIRRLIAELERAPSFAGTSLQASLEGVAGLLRRRGMVVMVSDLLAPVDQLEKQLSLLAVQGHELVLFHVMDRAEIDFTFGEAAQFRDMEGGKIQFIDPANARTRYLEKLEAHRTATRQLCERLRVDYRWTPTDAAVEGVLLEWLASRR